MVWGQAWDENIVLFMIVENLLEFQGKLLISSEKKHNVHDSDQEFQRQVPPAASSTTSPSLAPLTASPDNQHRCASLHLRFSCVPWLSPLGRSAVVLARLPRRFLTLGVHLEIGRPFVVCAPTAIVVGADIYMDGLIADFASAIAELVPTHLRQIRSRQSRNSWGWRWSLCSGWWRVWDCGRDTSWSL